MDHPTSAARSSLTPRRTVVAGLATVPLLIGTGAGTAAADPSAPALATGDTELALVTGEMTVTVATSFPRVVRYTHRKSGAVLHGQEDTVTTLVIDGTEVTPSGVTCRRTGHSAVAYVLSFAGGGRIEAEIAADGAVVTFRVTRTVESPDSASAPWRYPGCAW
ncbi:hypothetical protein ACFRAI_11280 [Streptomyces sp. NPDC056637]|uniref:hypothetical protein n=1 Tax=Streptomyces sp. NPDC056637 TaxID=3345886 RepID=UPI00369A6F8A